MDPNNQLRLATRIHFALLRQYGEDVPVSDLLNGGGVSREAMWVCQASCDEELVSLAQQFTAAHHDDTLAARVHRHAPRAHTAPAPLLESQWASDSSGFGASRLPTFMASTQSPATLPGWLKPSSWLRRPAG